MVKGEEFVDFQSFDTMESARFVLTNLLDEYEIPYEVANTKTETDVFKGTVSWVHPVVIKIPQNYFEQANHLLEEKAAESDYIPPHHYLFSFTDAELLEILQKPDEWSREDYVIAKNLLAQRGKRLSVETLNKFKAERLQTLSKPEAAEPAWIYAGFALALAGGFAGIFLGRIFYFSKKPLPNGQKVYTYDKETRHSGFLIFITGIVVWIIALILIIAVALSK